MCVRKLQLRSEQVAMSTCLHLTERRTRNYRLGTAVVVGVTKYNVNLVADACHKFGGYTTEANDFDKAFLTR